MFNFANKGWTLYFCKFSISNIIIYINIRILIRNHMKQEPAVPSFLLGVELKKDENPAVK